MPTCPTTAVGRERKPAARAGGLAGELTFAGAELQARALARGASAPLTSCGCAPPPASQRASCPAQRPHLIDQAIAESDAAQVDRHVADIQQLHARLTAQPANANRPGLPVSMPASSTCIPSWSGRCPSAIHPSGTSRAAQGTRPLLIPPRHHASNQLTLQLVEAKAAALCILTSTCAAPQSRCHRQKTGQVEGRLGTDPAAIVLRVRALRHQTLPPSHRQSPCTSSRASSPPAPSGSSVLVIVAPANAVLLKAMVTLMTRSLM